MRRHSWAIATAIVAAAGSAEAAPCDDLAADGQDNGITKLYIENGDTQEPMLKKLGKLLIQSNNKIRLVYRNRPTCNIRNDLFTDTTMITVVDGTTPRPVRYIPEDPAWDPTTAATTCTVPDAAPGQPIVLGIGATYLSSCAQTPAQPAGMGVLDGPIQAYGFITNNASTQVAITAEEGYLAYAFSEGTGGAAPWTVQELRFKRGNTASTTLTMSAAIRLLPTQMKAAADSGTSEALITSIMGATSNPEASLGILGTELFDSRRADIKLLAFKSLGQRYAYFPDVTNTSFNKQNVRDGHYLPWSPTPYIARIDANGIIHPDVKRVYELVMGIRDEAALDIVIKSGLVPQCAMTVARAGDGADLTLYSDPNPCGCFYDKSVVNGSTTCAACTVGDDAPCGGGRCRLGYCEAR